MNETVEALLGLRPIHAGDFVIFTPRLECPTCWGNRRPQDGSPEDFYGRMGVILAVAHPERSLDPPEVRLLSSPGHPYLVRLLSEPFGVWECARTEIEWFA